MGGGWGLSKFVERFLLTLIFMITTIKSHIWEHLGLFCRYPHIEYKKIWRNGDVLRECVNSSPFFRYKEKEEFCVEEFGNMFDVEPDKNSALRYIKALPKRVRFYHAVIDVRSLQSGEEYEKMKNVFIIMITPYDPFGLDRMVYTIKNCCMEVPEMPYEDGARTFFFIYEREEGKPSGKIEPVTYIYGKYYRRKCG